MRILRFTLIVVILASACRCLPAAELTARDLASPRMAVMFELDRPIQLLGNSLARDFGDLIRQTNAGQKALESAGFDKFRHAARFIEKSLGTDWHAGVTKLTAGGVIVVIEPSKTQGETDVTAVVTAADPNTLSQFITAVEVEIRRAVAANRAADHDETSYRSFQVHRVGNGYYTVAGRQLVVSNTRPGLQAALDRLADVVPQKTAERPFDVPQSLRLVDRHGNPPAILATVNLGLFRQDPNVRNALKLPANDPGPQLLLGGYFDLLRRAEFASAGLFVDGSTYELKVRVPAGSAGATAALAGFFAVGSSDSAPPLSTPPGAIFSAAWFRDYGRLWDARGELLNADLVRQLDAADANARELPTQFGIADLLHWLGPQWRVVAARQREQVYPQKIAQRLPALGLVVNVRDEPALRDRLLAPADGLILFGLNKLIEDFKKTDYRDARITTFRFSELAAGADPSKAFLRHLNPAFTLVRGHLILGSTAEIVRDLIDELDRQKSNAAESDAQTERVTDRQQLVLAEVSEYLTEFHEQHVRDAVRTQGISTDVAERDAELFRKVLERIGRIATRYVIAGDHFDLTLTLGQAE